MSHDTKIGIATHLPGERRGRGRARCRRLGVARGLLARAEVAPRAVQPRGVAPRERPGDQLAQRVSLRGRRFLFLSGGDDQPFGAPRHLHNGRAAGAARRPAGELFFLVAPFLTGCPVCT